MAVEEPDIPGCGALIATTAMGALPLGLVYAIAPKAFVLLVWGVGWGLVIWAARQPPRSVQDAAGPAPPPLSERGSEKKPQVSIVRDTAHPNRWVVATASRWMTVEITKEVEE